MHPVIQLKQGYISKILCPKIVLDSASTRYSLQAKLDRQYALIFIQQQAMKYYVRIIAEVSQIYIYYYYIYNIHACDPKQS